MCLPPPRCVAHPRCVVHQGPTGFSGWHSCPLTHYPLTWLLSLILSYLPLHSHTDSLAGYPFTRCSSQQLPCLTSVAVRTPLMSLYSRCPMNPHPGGCHSPAQPTQLSDHCWHRLMEPLQSAEDTPTNADSSTCLQQWVQMLTEAGAVPAGAARIS